MVYWHDDTGAATAGKHKSVVCSEISTKKEDYTDVKANSFNGCKDLRNREGFLLCLAQALHRQKGMKATMMKTKAPRTIPTMR